MQYPAPAFHGAVRLDSHFQPILSLSHQRVVGHEALLRGTDGEGRPVPPLILFGGLDDEAQRRLDRQAMGLHMATFAAHATVQEGQHQWLFVNLRPATFLEVMAQPVEQLVDKCCALGCDPADVVVEVTEDSLAGSERLVHAARDARAMGCLLALDDFGAGHSNFDRVWRLEPDIVKLDRSLVQRAACEPRAARIMAQMVSLLHETGALVLMEGIETETEAQLAMDSDVDLVQGYFFGRPQPALVSAAEACRPLEDLWDRFHHRHGSATQAEQQALAPYTAAFHQAALALQQGATLMTAAARFLRLPRAQMCYQLDHRGRQASPSVRAGDDRAVARRFAPLHDAAQACWARRPYFRRAVATVGTVQVTRPYLSIQGSGLCVTLSIAWERNGQAVVLCGDVGFDR